jgi:hypothetical protein
VPVWRARTMIRFAARRRVAERREVHVGNFSGVRVLARAGCHWSIIGGLGATGLFACSNDEGIATLAAVVDHYDSHMTLGLTPTEKADLVEYLKSL